jgi:transposase
MRGYDRPQTTMLTLVNPEKRVPANHPIRLIKALAEVALKELSPLFEQMYSEVGRPSIPPERLLKASLLMALYTVRSERMFCEQLDYNLLFRWFLELNWDEPAFDHSTFSRKRARLLEHDVAGEFFRTVVAEARQLRLTSDEHFTVDGTLIEAWASLKSLRAPRARSQAIACRQTIRAIRAWTSTASGARTRPTNRPLTPKRGWRKRAPAKRPGSVTPKAC